MGEGFNVTPYVNFGFADDRVIYADTGLVQATFGISSELALGDVSVVPSLNYTAESDDNADNQFWVGFKLGYAFM